MVEHAFEEHTFQAGERAQRQAFPSNGFFVILDGEAERQVDGRSIAGPTGKTTLRRGEWFGELSILFDERALTDVVAVRPLHCLVLPPEELKPLLHAYPQVMFRLLLGEARRLRDRR
jgi:CRP-like cAMP-binding protein